MKRFLNIGMLIVISAVFFCTTGWAITLGTNITVNDGANVTRTDGWYGGVTNTSYAQEDNEVAPNCVIGQQWDLEGFYMNGNDLTMVGGYDFRNGEIDPYRGLLYESGDLFIDIIGFSMGNSSGYDYVLDLDFSDSSFDIYELNANSVLSQVYFAQNAASNPWQYVSGGVLVGFDNFTYYEGLANSDVDGLLGGVHNAAVFDLSFMSALFALYDLSADTQFITHFTMECGNDNLMGQGSAAPVPEPATLILIGSGLIGLAGIRRKKI